MSTRCLLVLCLAMPFLAGCGYTPSDQTLVEQYFKKRSVLEQLSIVVRQLPEEVRVSREFISPGVAIDGASLGEVRRLLKDVGAESAVLWKNGQVMIYTGSKGFTRISAPLPEHLKPSLRSRLDRQSDVQNSADAAPGAGVFLRHIDDDWYVFLVHD